MSYNQKRRILKRLLIKLIHKLGYTVNKIEQPSEDEKKRITEFGKSVCSRISPDFTVLNGPFKGLKYPFIDITEAALIPKIVGSYESQLHPVVEEIVKKRYDNILDVGCAEGYYAVGFASRMPDTVVHGYDINEHDLRLCEKMALHNNLHNLTYNKACTPETLLNLDDSKRNLIFSDCEGYELQLFTEEVIMKLKHADFLIEVHDVVNPVISNTIYDRFKHSHNIRVIDNRDVDKSYFKGLEKLSATEKQAAFLEHRGGYNKNIHMEWFFITSKA